MPFNKTHLFVLAVIGTVLAWGTQPATAARIVEVRGRVELKRAGASRFQRAYPNTLLRPGDLLRPAANARVRILCDNGHERSVPAGVTTGFNSLCPQQRRTTRNGIPTPRGASLEIPYIISPRATFLLATQPVLRWNAVQGSETFTVELSGGELDWSQEVRREEVCEEDTCTLTYSGPALQPGIDYRLVVTTDTNRSSAEEGTPGLGFKLADGEQRREIETIAQRIQRQELPEAAQQLALADLYADYKLVAKALALLEESAKTQPSAAVYRSLGDLYLRIGLVREAEAPYLAAIQQADAAGEREEKAVALAGLSNVKAGLGQREEAVRRLQEAIAEYEQLGNLLQVEVLQKKLERLQ